MATWRDAAWAGLAAVVALVTLLQLGRLAYRAATDPAVALSTGMLALAFVITVVWLLTAFWVSMGAWRRSVWGCPFEHVPTSPAPRRCPRHRTTDVVDVPPPGASDDGPRAPGEPPEEQGR